MINCRTSVAFLVMLGGLSASAATVTPQQCQDLAKQAIPLADKCLAISDFSLRKACSDKIGSTLKASDDVFKACQTTMDPLKQQYIAKEKAKYPSQASAFGSDGGNGNGNNNNNGSPNSPGMPNQGNNNMGGTGNNGNNGNNGNGNNPGFSPSQCQAQLPAVQKKAEACLNISEFNARSACFQAVPQGFPNGMFDSCGQTFDPIRAAIVAKEKSKYPSQASAVPGPGGPNGNNGPNNGPNTGMNNGGQNSGPNGSSGSPSGSNNNNGWTPDKCSAQVPGVQKQADNCLKISDFKSRVSCFDKIGSSVPAGMFDSCRSVFDPLKSAIMASEKSKYPTQASALDGGGNNNGPQNGSNNSPGNSNNNMNNSNNKSPSQSMPSPSANMPKVDCGKIVTDARAGAMKCLPIASQTSRKQCFDAIGQAIDKAGAKDSCRDQLDQLKSDILSQEHQKYPTQPPSIN